MNKEINNFELFDKIVETINIQRKKEKSEEKIEEKNNCKHKNIEIKNKIKICQNCGIELDFQNISTDKEWRFYGNSDSRHSNDPNRVQARKSEERNIYKDCANLRFSNKIIEQANIIYAQVTNGKIFRGNSRKSIVFACIFHSFKLSGRPQSHEKLINVFGLSRKAGLKGLKMVNLNAPKNSPIRTTYITPINLVEEIMDKFSATIKQKREVIELYHKIKNRSSRLNRSRPQSVSAGLIYYWISENKINISLKDFTKKVSLSELTINKIAKEIKSVLKKMNNNK